jgi:hypothetical protein
MNSPRRLAATAALIFFGLSAPAMAGELLLGVYDHDVDVNVALGGFEPGAQLGVGYRTERLEALRSVGRPFAYANVMINTAAATNYAHAGLGWRFDLGRRLYFAPAIGAAVHDGNAENFQATDDELYLGSRVLFAPELNLGWRLSERASVEASWIHLSHGQTRGGQNPGVDDIGVRLAWKLGGR